MISFTIIWVGMANTYQGGDNPVLDPANANPYTGQYDPSMLGQGSGSGSTGGLQLSQGDAQSLADFLGIPGLADNPSLLSEIVGLGGYDSRIAHQSAQLSAQASYLSAQAAGAHYAAQDAVARGQLQLAQQHEAFAQKLDAETQRLAAQKQVADAQMAYVSELGKLAIRPEDAYKYEFARYGMQAPQGNAAVQGLPIPDIVRGMLATPQAGAPDAAPSTVNPALAGLIPGATPSAGGSTQVAGPTATSGIPAGFTGQTMTLSPYLQNLFAQQGNPTAGIPVPSADKPLPTGYQYPQIGTPSAQSLRYLSPDQKGNLAGYAQDVNGTPAGSFQSNIDQLAPQGSGLALPTDYGAGGATSTTADQGSTGFATGGLILHRSHPLLAEGNVPEQVTPRPDLAALMGGPNVHAPGPQAGQAGIGPGLAPPGPTPGPSPAGGGPGPGLLAALAMMHGGLHAASPSSTAGAPGGLQGLLGGAGGLPPGGAPGAMPPPPAGGLAPAGVGAPPPSPSGGMGAPGGMIPPPGPPPGGMIPPPPGPGASLNFPPLPPMSPGVASMQMPTSREVGRNPTEPIVPKVPIPDGPLGANSTGAPVTALQRALERLGYFKLPFGANYGNYGPATTAAVSAFQRDHGHTPTVLGNHDKQTAHLIRQRLSGYGNQPHGPNPTEMRGGDQHPTAAMTGTRSSGSY